MKFLATAAVIGIMLVAATPVVHRSGSLYAQTGKEPKERPRPQEPAGRPEPRPQAPGRADASGKDRPTPPPPPPPKSTGEPELKRRNP